mmetsp:Transcript_25403/g.49739  ORF Transcript_25403/g.49739 Transcript_25403/m.49739 type:complete len:424 (-) Transcript_25403:58-1329(-)|eukprot:CAMPEP_0172672414 /NCGR_PEP_ID=MMETSP1074-20121228/11531_1 /TAXON_ID=2916 /ORGANISM="Ceratium fusus, Strain PA161109" /LENGTH=423 /DNA_ID=CAMNT_0013489595 /DNA_START=73 /DNA_END=1344 /DNA_ORIENTATION=-
MTSTKVFVGSLPPTIDEATFRQLFEPYGNIVSTVCNAPKRYGFIIYTSMEEAQAAIGAMAGFDFEGQPLTVKLADNQGARPSFGGAGGTPGAAVPSAGGAYDAAGTQAWSTSAVPEPGAGTPAIGNGGGWSPAPAAVQAVPATTGMTPLPGGGEVPIPPPPEAGPGASIYVKGLPANMTAETVHATFAPYGNVIDCKVLVACGQSDDGTGQSVAIVRMGSMNEANWLVENLNGNIPQGLSRPVMVSFKGQRPDGAPHRYQPYGAQPYGADAMITTNVPNTQYGYAAPSYGSSMVYAAPDPNNGAIMQRPLDVNGSARLGAANEHLIPGLSETIACAGTNSKLYVKNLPLNGDDLYLFRAFAPFGCVLSVKALQKEGYVIGFVQYATDAEAATAIAALNGKSLTDGTVLHVSVKTANYRQMYAE